MIPYTLKRNRRSHSVRISINCNATVTVSAPWFVSKRRIENFLLEKKAWIEEKINFFKQQDSIIPKENKSVIPSVARTKKLISERLKIYNAFYNFEYKRVSIKNTRSKWGSCSTKKNLNFNAKLWHLPLELVDYVVVHELCHLQEMNHSKNFWNLVQQQIPNYKERRMALKKVGI